jgi:hypothetical protein
MTKLNNDQFIDNDVIIPTISDPPYFFKETEAKLILDTYTYLNYLESDNIFWKTTLPSTVKF